MSIPGSASPLFLSAAAAAAPAGYEIERSLRFNDDDSAYLSKTFASAGDRKTWTWSGWVKRSAITTADLHISTANIGSGLNNTNYLAIIFRNDKILIGGALNVFLLTTQVLRDPSAWYHVLVSLDTTQASASDRLKLYINGSLVTAFDTDDRATYVTQNIDLAYNNNVAHAIGAHTAPGNYFDGYLADVHFIDGQALAATDFGEYDSNNVWQPKAYSGTYGTNGFHLDFSDNSSNAALGDDSSGNNNDWTVNNLVATAGLETANQGFDVLTYTGNGSTQSISSLEFQPDFVWIKQRNTAKNHGLYDIVRGATKRLTSNGTNAEITDANLLTSFDSNGFSLGNDSEVNETSGTYVAWCWKAGGTASSNTDGTITSSVSANTTYGFSIVKYTMGSSDVTVGHGLGAEPKWIITRRFNNTDSWIVYHASLGKDKYLFLNGNNVAFTDTSDAFTSTNNSVFDARQGLINAGECIAYCWSEVSGFSKFGSYEGASTVTVTTGFKPRWILLKNVDTAGSWSIFDSERDSDLEINHRIYANESSAEGTNIVIGNFTNTGFTLTNQGNSNWNTTGDTFVYAAFAGTPPGEIIDSLIDTPTNGTQTDTGAGGEVVGNYATLNPVDPTTVTLSNGNLDCVTNNTATHVRGTIGISSGKWYWEIVASNLSGNLLVGICTSSASFSTDLIGSSGYTYYSANGNKYTSSASSYGASWTTGDVIGVAFDADAGALTFYKNGTSQGQAFSGLTSGPYFPAAADGDSGASSTFAINFGQRAFAYTAPSGFKALCTTNLTDPTIADGSTAMDVALYTGNGTSQTISGLSFSPDWLWIKERSSTSTHFVFDTIRGVNKCLRPAETTEEAELPNLHSAFTSDGFTVGSSAGTNESSQTYVGWTWDAGTGSPVSNTDGSITSSVRANASAGFSIVSYTGNGSNATVGHGLGVAPAMIMFKKRSATQNWVVYHSAMGATKALYLDQTVAAVTSSNFFQDTQPTSSVFSLGTGDGVNTISQTFIAYCFAPVEGYSSALSWQGNGSSDGVFIYTGFRVAWFIWKRTDSIANWYIYDSARSTFNVVNDNLEPNTSDAENILTSMNVDFLSNGIKVRGSDGDINGSGGDYIGFAFAEHPLKHARAR